MNKTMKVIRTIAVESSDLGDKVKKARAGRKVTDLAYRANISPAYWYKIEANEPESVSEETLRNIEKALNINLNITFE